MGDSNLPTIQDFEVGDHVWWPSYFDFRFNNILDIDSLKINHGIVKSFDSNSRPNIKVLEDPLYGSETASLRQNLFKSKQEAIDALILKTKELNDEH